MAAQHLPQDLVGASSGLKELAETITTMMRSNLHIGQYAFGVHFGDRRWWKHCHSLESPDISTSFFVRSLKKWTVDLPYTPVVSIATG